MVNRSAVTIKRLSSSGFRKKSSFFQEIVRGPTPSASQKSETVGTFEPESYSVSAGCLMIFGPLRTKAELADSNVARTKKELTSIFGDGELNLVVDQLLSLAIYASRSTKRLFIYVFYPKENVVQEEISSFV